MARNERHEFQQNQRQRGEGAESGNRAKLRARLDQAEREASGEPTECGRGGAHFSDRDENGIAKQQTRRGSGANREDGRARRPKTRMHAAQALRHRAGSAQREEQPAGGRSEEHTSELQSLAYLVCRLLLEKKKNTETIITSASESRH